MNSKRKLLLAMGSGLVSSGFAQSPASAPPQRERSIGLVRYGPSRA